MMDWRGLTAEAPYRAVLQDGSMAPHNPTWRGFDA
jgi:hypothetical protein